MLRSEQVKPASGATDERGTANAGDRKRIRRVAIAEWKPISVSHECGGPRPPIAGHIVIHW
jgi:hypothetical protein